MVGPDVALVAAVVVRPENVQNAGVAVAVPVGRLGEVPVGEMLHVADVGEGNAAAVLAHDVRHVVVRVGVQAAGAECQAVVGVVHHGQEAVDGWPIHQQPGQAENVPRGIVHVDGHFDIALMAGGHDGLQEVFQVVPQLLLRHGTVLLKQLI